MESIVSTEIQDENNELLDTPNKKMSPDSEGCTTNETTSPHLETNTNSDKNNHETKSGDKFYEDAKKYWSNIPATVNGMLGGFGEISSIDLKGSHVFLKTLFSLKPAPGKRYALDCGAGIGRITKGLLLHFFEKVDIVEQDKQFTQKIKEYIGDKFDRIGEIYNVGLQEFMPEPMKYDVVWCQWVLGHLTDDDLMKFFMRIKLSLCKNGILIIKENVSSSNCLELDDKDSSMTRPLKVYQDIIKKNGFRILKSVKQANFPKGLYPVYILACR